MKTFSQPTMRDMSLHNAGHSTGIIASNCSRLLFETNTTNMKQTPIFETNTTKYTLTEYFHYLFMCLRNQIRDGQE